MAPDEFHDKMAVLIVDDMPENVEILSAFLGSKYRTMTATTGKAALEQARRNPGPDLILLDVVMNDIDGLEVCRELKRDPKTAEIPIIFLTGQSDMRDEEAGLAAGAVDYIHKPFSPPLVLARVSTHVQMKQARDLLRGHASYLEREVERRTREVMAIQDVALVAMGSLAETRDNETGAHIRRTQQFMLLLATEASKLSFYSRQLPPEAVELIVKSAPLHDIGKVGIPDHILLKPGKLTPEEFEIMKTHTTLGHQSIEAASRMLPTRASFLGYASDIALSHHERWDGHGYPRGLAGDSIPLPGRMMALADVYDALRSERVYKSAYSHEEAVDIMTREADGQFDPKLFRIFRETAPEWAEVFTRFEV
jgi:putative two-component system response regulator